MEPTVYNFHPGPGVLFRDVLKRVQSELTNWNNTGMSIIELSHRTPEFQQLLDDTKRTLRRLADIPETYDILFVQGGATQVFSSLPMNLCKTTTAAADYVVNGYWSHFASEEARKYCDVHIAASDETNTSCPAHWNLTENAAYVHYCSNETIHGCEYKHVPEVSNGAPLVCDMSSNFLARPMDVRKYGMIYAGAHKNVGPAGMTVIIIQKTLLARCDARKDLPHMLNYRLLSEAGSMLNTPPVFAIYFANLVFKRLVDLGGLAAMQERNDRKANLLYDELDNSDGFYTYAMREEHRSTMNVPFSLRSTDLEDEFLREAEKQGLLGLRGHSLVGHCRASIYNGMPVEGVEALVTFMRHFRYCKK
jgi:phosphoserine aminotransferase